MARPVRFVWVWRAYPKSCVLTKPQSHIANHNGLLQRLSCSHNLTNLRNEWQCAFLVLARCRVRLSSCLRPAVGFKRMWLWMAEIGLGLRGGAGAARGRVRVGLGHFGSEMHLARQSCSLQRWAWVWEIWLADSSCHSGSIFFKKAHVISKV